MSSDPNCELSNLLSHIRRRADIQNADWVDKLEQRKKDELIFHNEARGISGKVTKSANDGDTRANRRWYSITRRSDNYLKSWISENAMNHVFLDYACGNGGQTRRAAQAGASLAIGIDISEQSIINARALANENGVNTTCAFLQADCENTQLPDNSIDRILCCGMLHHLELSFALPEMRRILKPGGKVLAVEAFGHNPFIQAYRKLTPKLRTAFEADHIISQRDVNFASRFFKIKSVKHWHLSAIPAALFKDAFFFPAVWNPLDLLDRVVFERFPVVQKWAWQISFEMVKSEK